MRLLLRPLCWFGFHDWVLRTRDWRYYCHRCGKTKMYVTHA